MINLDLLTRVRDAIKAEPRAFDMDFWCAESKRSPCGTTMCIAGYASALSGAMPAHGVGCIRDGLWGLVSGDAGDQLGLTAREQPALFHNANWPEPYRTRYANADRPSRRARVAVALLDEVIARGGVWWAT